MKHYLIGFLLALLSSQSLGQGFNPPLDRQIKLEGRITKKHLEIPHIIDTFLLVSDEPIGIRINSPGGYIAVGQEIIRAIERAQNQGVEVRCLVEGQAYSMALFIFAYCSEHWVTDTSTLMWHPVRRMMRGVYTAKELRMAIRDIDLDEIPLVHKLWHTMQIDRVLFDYHREKETIWNVWELKNSTNFFNIHK